MPTTTLHSRSWPWTSFQSWAILAALGVISAWSLVALYVPRTTPAATPAQQGGKDLEAYRRIVARVHGGEDYYSAAGDELRTGGYASSSIFNWRLPTYAWLLAAFPRPEWGQALLGLLALTALAVAYIADREGEDGSVLRSMVLLLAMAGAFVWCIDGDAFFAQELWAGVLIALAIGASYKRTLTPIAVVAGLAALCMRELALPYVLVAMVLACRQRQWREVAAWCFGLALFAAFWAWHAWQVSQHLTGAEFAESEGWIQFGGPAFVVRTCQMNVWLFKLPAWVGLIYLVASLLGLAWWRGPMAFRVCATVGLYLVAFLIVGKPFNAYWGLLYVPLLPLGLVRVPHAIRARCPRNIRKTAAD